MLRPILLKWFSFIEVKRNPLLNARIRLYLGSKKAALKVDMPEPLERVTVEDLVAEYLAVRLTLILDEIA